MNKRIAAVIVLAISLLGCLAPPWIANTSQPTVTAPAKALPTVTTTPQTAPTPWSATIRQPTVNVRDSAGGDPTGTYLVAGDKVRILYCVGNWCKIEKPGGWVFIGCLTYNPNGLGCAAK